MTQYPEPRFIRIAPELQGEYEVRVFQTEDLQNRLFVGVRDGVEADGAWRVKYYGAHPDLREAVFRK